MPACASWFSLTGVHEIEKKALGEWFRTRKQSSSASVSALLISEGGTVREERVAL
jgi:hypothetical protein